MLFDEYAKDNPIHATRGLDDVNYGNSGDAVAINATEVLPIIYNASGAPNGDLLISNTLRLTEVTYEMWVKPKPGVFFEAPGVEAIFDGDITVMAGDNIVVYDYEDYERIHLVIRVGTTIDLWVNGSLVDSVEPYFILDSLEGDIVITDSIFDGVAVYDRVLQDLTIVRHYQAGAPNDDYPDVLSHIADSHILTLELTDEERNIIHTEKYFEELSLTMQSFPMELPPEAQTAKLTWRGTADVVVNGEEVINGEEFDVLQSNNLTVVTNGVIYDLELVVYDDSDIQTGDRVISVSNTAAVAHPPIEQNSSAGTGGDVIVGAGTGTIGTVLWWQYDPVTEQWGLESQTVGGTGNFTITNPSRIMRMSFFSETLTAPQVSEIEDSAFGRHFTAFTADTLDLADEDPSLYQSDWTVVTFG